MSVPQIVESVSRITASPGPALGRGTSRISSLFGPTNTFARIVSALRGMAAPGSMLGKGRMRFEVSCPAMKNLQDACTRV